MGILDVPGYTRAQADARFQSINFNTSIGAGVDVVGDSRIAQISADATSQTGKYWVQQACAFYSMANGLMGQRMRLINNFGKSGDTVNQVLSRALPLVLASTSPNLIYWCGVNSISAGLTAAQTFPDMVYFWDAVLRQGKRIFIFNEPGNGNFGQSAMKEVQRLNQLIANFVSQNKNTILIDAASALRDNTLNSLFLPAPTSGDQLHTIPVGGAKLGAAFAAAATNLFPALPTRHQGALDEPSYNPMQVISNGMCRITTGGVLGSNMTGSVPASWTASREGTGGVGTCSTTPHTVPHFDSNGLPDVSGAPSGLGNWFHIAGTGTATGDRVTAFNAFPVSLLTPGQYAQSQVEILVMNSYSLIGVEICQDINCTVDGVAASYASYDYYSENTAFQTGPAAYRMLAMCPEKQIPPNATSINSATLWCRAVFGTLNLTQRTADIYIGTAVTRIRNP